MSSLSGRRQHSQSIQVFAQSSFDHCFGSTPRDNFLKTLIIFLVAIIGFGATALHSEEAVKTEPNSKDIPKPVLMLGLFCNSALVAIKGQYLANPRALPWKADGAAEKKITELLGKLDPNNSGYAKAVKDGALTQDEANFLNYNASHEAVDWVKNVRYICAATATLGGEYEQCLKEVNSEIFKCYRQIMDQVK
jgi:hypothetical protein